MAAIVSVVVVAWAASFAADLILPTYDPPAALHGLMSAIVGGIVARWTIRRARNGNNHPHHHHDKGETP